MLYLYHITSFRYFELTKDQYLIGRTSGDLVFENDNAMSGKHALLTLETNDNITKVFVEDLVSKNRTVVDRAQIPPRTKIRLLENGLLELGEQIFLLTKKNDLKLEEINNLIDHKLEKQIIALETLNLVQKMRDTLTKELEALISTEEAAKQKLIENRELIKKAEDEMLGLERKKKFLLAELEAEANEIKNQIFKFTNEMGDANSTLSQITDDIESLKTKIGRLTTLPKE